MVCPKAVFSILPSSHPTLLSLSFSLLKTEAFVAKPKYFQGVRDLILTRFLSGKQSFFNNPESMSLSTAFSKAYTHNVRTRWGSVYTFKMFPRNSLISGLTLANVFVFYSLGSRLTNIY